MITYLPYPDFLQSVIVLNDKHLERQQVEVLAILDILHEITPNTGWANHPVIDMWRGHEPQLAQYGTGVCAEWKKRGNKNDECMGKLDWHLECATSGSYTLAKPGWFGDTQVHLSHQSNLLRQDPEHYGKIFQGIPDDLPFLWPKA